MHVLGSIVVLESAKLSVMIDVYVWIDTIIVTSRLSIKLCVNDGTVKSRSTKGMKKL